MYLSVPTTSLRLVESILRDLNVQPVEVHLPVLADTQLINIRDDEVAKNCIHRLKSVGIIPELTSTV
jgi:hypothetical protein